MKVKYSDFKIGDTFSFNLKTEIIKQGKKVVTGEAKVKSLKL